MNFLVCIILLIIGSITVNAKKCSKIVGGEEVNITDYPYYVIFEFYSELSCGATIIGKKWVVTAAHCTHGQLVDIMSVRAGVTYLDETGQQVMVKEFYQHPQYDEIKSDYDISLLELETELTFSSVVQPIELAADGSDVAPGTKVVVIGCGVTEEDGKSPSPVLLKTEVPVVNRDECRKTMTESDITENMICAGVPEGGADACNGDSGGPLVSDGKLVGIVSFAYGCARLNSPGVYSRVGTLRSYIKEHSGI